MTNLQSEILKQLAASGIVERRGSTWIYGESVSVDFESDPKAKAVRERSCEVQECLRKAGYVIDEDDSDHDSFCIEFRLGAERSSA